MSFGISIGDIIKLCELAGRVYKNCRDCSGEYKSLTSEARSLSNQLEDIQDKYDRIPSNKRQQLLEAYQPCVEVLQDLDKLLQHYDSLDTRSKRTWDRLKWDPEQSKTLRERLISSVSMLNAFYTSLIHDSQVLILEALRRLERDYRGGHREQSIASIGIIASDGADDGAEDEDAAWTQILRDLEDVGISRREATSYRNLVVDWLVSAVNEGRLLEQLQGQDSLHATNLPSTSANTLLQPSANLRLSAEQEASKDDHEVVLLVRNTPQARSHSPPGVSFPLPLLSSSQAEHIRETLPVETKHEGSELSELEQTVQHIVAGFRNDDFPSAELFLEKLLATVELGKLDHSGPQPDRRMLRHLIGTCASRSGNFTKAKGFFESVSNGIYLNRDSLDEGDVAAALWLGDVCLQLHEHDNAVLAYSVAFEGSVGRFGIARDRTRRVIEELAFIDHWLNTFQGMEYSFQQNTDPTTIFMYTHPAEKRDLIQSVKTRLSQTFNSTMRQGIKQNGDKKGLRSPDGKTSETSFLSNLPIRPSSTIGMRPRVDLKVSESFLIGPLVSLSVWPLPWDPTLSLQDVVELDYYMGRMRAAPLLRPSALVDRQLPTNTLGDSRSLIYVTKRGSEWLISTVEKGLATVGIEFAAHTYNASIVCRLDKLRYKLAFTEGVEISFKKVQFRNVYGVKISDVKWTTRDCGGRDTSDFKKVVKGILEKAEAGASKV